MLEQLFHDVYMRQQLLAGPMGPYLDGLVSNLLDLGYCHSQARKIVRTAAALGQWLAERGLNPTEAGKTELRAFMAMQRRTPAGRLPDGAVGCTRLPGLLRSMSILSKQPVSPADPILRRFDGQNHKIVEETRFDRIRASFKTLSALGMQSCVANCRLPSRRRADP
jgi:hypothetical protein